MACTEKQRAAGRYYYWLNHDKRIAQMAIWRAAHREEKRAYNRAYGIAHREELRVNNRRYSELHHEEIRQRARERYRLRHPPKPRLSDEEKLAKAIASRLVHRDVRLERQRARYREHIEEEHERGRRYREDHRDAIRERARARCRRTTPQTRERDREKSRLYYQAHKAERYEKQRARRNDPAHRQRYLDAKRAYYHRTKYRHRHRLTPQEILAKQRAKTRAWHHRESRLLTTRYVRMLLCKGTTLKPTDFPLAIVRVARAKIRLLRAARQHGKEVTDGRTAIKEHGGHTAAAR